MKNDLTELVFILDRSGSMSGLEQDTIGGFNSMIEKQKSEAGSAYVTTILFDHEILTLHDRLNLSDIPKMTDRDYTVRGSTALVDAIGKTIRHIEGIHKYARKEDVPEKTLFIITTDGMENASRRYSSEEVKKMIEKKKKQGWEFLFIGANIDAVETGSKFGIERDRVANYKADSIGTAALYDTVSSAVIQVRSRGCLDSDWSEVLEEDLRRRKH